MREHISYIECARLLLDAVDPVGTEKVALHRCAGRILARDLAAADNVPAFDRSPYDGYALRSADVRSASHGHPVTLDITEEIPAGAVPAVRVEAGTAAKVLTGAPIPEGADAVVMFEKTRFTPQKVTVFAPMKPGENIVRTGEDIRRGQILARRGTVIDPGLAGTLAAQSICEPEVYRRPVIGLISTGSELLSPGEQARPGMIYNSNRYTMTAALEQQGCAVTYLGTAEDRAEAIAELLRAGLEECDGVVLTGGVSVGDYDVTPDAMEMCGAVPMIRGVDIKPGMACAYALRDGKPVFALSGNPASAITNFYAVVAPAVRKLCGRADCLAQEISLTLTDGFSKGSKVTRLLRGRVELTDGQVMFRPCADQGNVVISSTIGCNAMAVVPAGSGAVEGGQILKGFML